MKAIRLYAIAILALTCASCSEIPENNDPILGKWSKTTVITPEGKGEVQRTEEWIFNDVFMGRYEKYENGNLVFFHDFDWSVSGTTYTISYRGDIDLADIVVVLTDETADYLKLTNGNLFAQR